MSSRCRRRHDRGSLAAQGPRNQLRAAGGRRAGRRRSSQGFAREDGAGIIRPQIAIGKAWGALGMGLGSRTLARRVAEQPQQQAFFGALNAMSDGRVVPAAGGVLIRDAGGAILGAVGISGDVSDKDEACALAGIEAARLTADPGA